MRSLKELVVKTPPHEPPAYDEVIVGAMRALLAGNANEGQQKTAVKYIIENLCQYYDISYVPGEDGRRNTDFAEGKRFVAACMITLSKVITGGNER